jgi:flagellar motor switch protein FliG
MVDSRLSPAEKSALTLLSLGKEVAAQVMQHLNESEVKRISRAFLAVTEIDRETQMDICREFRSLLKAGETLLIDGREFAKEVIAGAFGEDDDNNLLDYVTGSRKEPISSILQEVPFRILTPFISAEHPQTISFLMTKMHPDQAAHVLQSLTEEQQTDILVRVSQLNNVRNEVLDEVREVLRASLRGTSASEEEELFGPKAAADILNFVERNNEERILSEIEEMYPEIADQIRNLMFTFEDIIRIDDKGIQQILKEVPRDQLVLALKTASPELTDSLFKNMSSRAAEMIKEDLDVMGPVRVKDVEKAQQGIVDTVRRLESEGKVVIGGGSEDELV